MVHTTVSKILKRTAKKTNHCYLLIAVLFTLSSCMSLDYLSGIYEQNPDQRIDVLVRVKNKRDTAVTDLVLNDFYVRHNSQVLERKNNLRLNEDLSAVKLYLVILIDQRKNDLLKYDFERTRQAIQAYLTLQSPHTYIKIITYDREARSLNPEFSNDKEMLRSLLTKLDTVQMETSNTALDDALVIAKESIETLPYGTHILDPQKFTIEQVKNAKGPLLYNTAILLMNHNKISISDLAPYNSKYNFVMLNSSGSIIENQKTKRLVSQTPELKLLAEEEGTIFEVNEVPTIFKNYELPPADLNQHTNQSVAIEMVDQVWKSLANIVNGYYWLSYNKYTDLNVEEPRLVTVSLTQYGRSKDSGKLNYYAPVNLADSLPSDSLDKSTMTQNRALLPLAGIEEENRALLAENEAVSLEPEPELLPPAISEGRFGNLLALLPGKYFELSTAKKEYPEEHPLVEENPVVDDFEILTPLEEPGLLVNSENAPRYTAEPIPLVSAESLPVARKPLQNDLDDPALAPFTNGRYIQVGAFVKLKNLYRVIENLEGKYDVRAVSSVVHGLKYNRCIIGPFKDKAETEKAFREVKASKQFYDAFIIQKSIEEWIGN